MPPRTNTSPFFRRVAVAYILTLVQPGGTFPNADSLAADTARTIGGALFAAFFVTGLIIGQFTSGLAAQASVWPP